MSKFKENILIKIFIFIIRILDGIINLVKCFFILLIEFILKISPVIISFVFFFIQYQLLIKYDQNLSIYQPQCLAIGISSFYCFAIINNIKHLPVKHIEITKLLNKKIKYIENIHKEEKGAITCFALIHFILLIYFIFTDFSDLLTGSKMWFTLNFTIIGLSYLPAAVLCVGFNKKKIDLVKHFKGILK